MQLVTYYFTVILEYYHDGASFILGDTYQIAPNRNRTKGMTVDVMSFALGVVITLTSQSALLAGYHIARMRCERTTSSLTERLRANPHP